MLRQSSRLPPALSEQVSSMWSAGKLELVTVGHESNAQDVWPTDVQISWYSILNFAIAMEGNASASALSLPYIPLWLSVHNRWTKWPWKAKRDRLDLIRFADEIVDILMARMRNGSKDALRVRDDRLRYNRQHWTQGWPSEWVKKISGNNLFCWIHRFSYWKAIGSPPRRHPQILNRP